MAETTTFIKRIPDDAKIIIEIFEKELGIQSKAELTGEMINIADAYHHDSSVFMVVQEMLSQIGSVGFPPLCDFNISIIQDGEVSLNKSIKGSLLNDLSRSENTTQVDTFFNEMLNQIDYSEETEIIIPENND